MRGADVGHDSYARRSRYEVARVTAAVGFVLAVFATTAVAAEPRDWQVRVGAHNIAPKSNNHSIVEVDDATMLTFNLTRFVTNKWAIELLAALPFEHDIDLVSGGRVASTKHLPPTLSVQYHFNREGAVRPYVGAGVNVTLFFQESTTGALDGGDLSLDTSVGPAAQLGVDVDITDVVFANAEVRYMQIESAAKLNGTSIGDVEIDPWLFGLSIGMRF